LIQAIAMRRYKVEQGFGTMKLRCHQSRAPSFAAGKTQCEGQTRLIEMPSAPRISAASS